MELIDRYLNAVRFWLPRAQEDDIIAELGEDLRSQIEDRETALGRALNEDELAEILKKRGHPMSVASGYLPQRYLIGPALYPAYMVVVRLVILWIVLPILILIAAPIAIATAADPTMASIKALWDAAMGCVFALGVITLVFAIIERHPIRELENWDPRKLPKIPARPLKSLSDPKPVDRAQAIVEMACSVLFTAFFLHFIWFRNSFDLGDAHIVLAPVWRTLLWPILLIGLSGLAIAWVSVAFRSNTRVRSGVRMAVDVASLGVLGVMAKAGTLITLTVRNLPADQIAQVAKWTELGTRLTLAAAGFGIMVDLVQEAVRYARTRRAA
jgi:hypothetical protein